MNGRAEAKPRHNGIEGSSGLVPGPWFRRRLAGKGMIPSSLAERLSEAVLRLMIQAPLAGQQRERRHQSGRQSNLPAGRFARAEEMEEELHRPPFRHQILLPIRRGEVASRRWQRHHASVATQRLARSTADKAGPPSRIASRPGRPTLSAERAKKMNSRSSEVEISIPSLKCGAWRRKFIALAFEDSPAP